MPGGFIFSLEEVVGVDTGPSIPIRQFAAVIMTKQTGDLCPSYLYFKEAGQHEQKFGFARYGAVGQCTCR